MFCLKNAMRSLPHSKTLLLKYRDYTALSLDLNILSENSVKFLLDPFKFEVMIMSVPKNPLKIIECEGFLGRELVTTL